VHMMPSYKLGFQHSFPYMMLPQAPDQASFPSARSALRSYKYDKRNKYASNSAASLAGNHGPSDVQFFTWLVSGTNIASRLLAFGNASN
jgi:hypothetical protein